MIQEMTKQQSIAIMPLPYRVIHYKQHNRIDESLLMLESAGHPHQLGNDGQHHFIGTSANAVVTPVTSSTLDKSVLAVPHSTPELKTPIRDLSAYPSSLQLGHGSQQSHIFPIDVSIGCPVNQSTQALHFCLQLPQAILNILVIQQSRIEGLP